MTPKEKAKKLVNKFLQLTYTNEDAKECALICVDSILDAVFTIPDKKYDFHLEVKQEIRKL